MGYDLIVENAVIRDIKVIHCTGRVDSGNYHLLNDAIEAVIKSGHYKIVVELSGVEYISSAGWGTFVGNLNLVRTRGGTIELAAMRREVNNVYKLMEFDEVLTAHDNLDEAVKKLSVQNK